MADTLSRNISFHWFRRPNASTKRPWSVKIFSHNYATSLKLKDIYIPQAIQTVWLDISTGNLRPLIPKSLRGHSISRSIKNTLRLIKIMSNLVLIRLQISRYVIVYHVKIYNSETQNISSYIFSVTDTGLIMFISILEAHFAMYTTILSLYRQI